MAGEPEDGGPPLPDERSQAPSARFARWALVPMLYAAVAAVLIGVTDDAINDAVRDNPGRGWLELARAWALVMLGALAIYLVLVSERRRRAEVDRRLEQASAALEAIDQLSELSLRGDSEEAMQRELLAAIAELLDAQAATVFLHDPDRSVLVARASVATAGGRRTPQDLEVPVGQGLVGRAAGSLAPAVDGSVAHGEPRARARFSAVAPMVLDGELLGVLQVRSEWGPPGQAHSRILQLAAERMATLTMRFRQHQAQQRLRLGADHARRHLALLSEAGRELARVFDDIGAGLDALASIVVPSFADWFAVDLIGDDQRLHRVTRAHNSDLPAAELVAREAEHPDYLSAVRRVLDGGRSELVFDVADPPPELPGSDADHLRLAGALGVESCIIAPIRTRGLSVGALVLGTSPPRRGYRPSDLAAATELAARVATAVERVGLHREAVGAAERAADHAARVHRLMEAAIEIGSSATMPDVLDVVAAQAARVLEAPGASARLEADGVSLVTSAGSGDPDEPGPHEVRAPLRGPDGRWLGDVRAHRSDPFDTTDESLLVSLAEIGAVALQGARSLDAARASEARLRTFIETSPLGILELDASARVQRWNAAAAELLQLHGDPAGVGFLDAVGATERRRELAVGLRRAGSGEAVTGIEVPVEVRPGEVRWFSVALAPLQAPEGPVAEMMAVIADVSERHRAEERLLQAQKMDAIGRLAGGLAHDFNNLLTAVIGYSELLVERVPEGSDLRPDLDQVLGAGRRAAELTGRLLTMSRGHVMADEVVDVDDIVVGLEPMIRRACGSAIEVALDTRATRRVRGDRGQLEQVLLNLVLNARDAMSAGGTLTIRSRVVDLDPAEAPDGSSLAGGLNVELMVADTGDGMGPDTLEHCLEPFFTTKEREKGTGLGLAMVYGIVNRHGGRLLLDSAPGEGTRVAITLPAVPVDEAVRSGTLTSPAAAGEVRRVLVADDDPLVRELARRALHAAGHEVHVAEDGVHALAVAARVGHLDLLVTDVVMPRLGGPALADRLESERDGLRVLFISGYTEDALDRCREGAHLLTKPFTPEALTRKVQELLAAPQPQGSKR